MATKPDPRQLSSLPEELLERILALCLPSPPSILPPRPLWHRQPLPPSSRGRTHQPHKQARPSTAPLLVSHTFLRISTPLFYHTLLLVSPAQVSSLLRTLRANPALGQCVKQLAVLGIWHDVGPVLTFCPGVQVLDIMLDTWKASPGREDVRDPKDNGAEAFCSAMERLQNVKHLTVRKGGTVYLTQSKPGYVIQRLATAIRTWKHLVSPTPTPPPQY